ncbi:carbohydrate sulfotransferase 12-like [Babylonia areolata]|uniref:carbohydrate sulfotransferase 12-like n=1 Tax=Babylonia areolata TaxID=304850 RepID=UPI003FD69198
MSTHDGEITAPISKQTETRTITISKFNNQPPTIITSEFNQPPKITASKSNIQSPSITASSSNQSHDDTIYEARVKHVKDACKVLMTAGGHNTVSPLGLPTKEAGTGFFVSSVHKLVYCSVEKVGSSFWKRAFRVLNSVEPPKSLFRQSGLTSHVDNENITFENKSTQWQQNQLDSSLKFLFVRDPFSRTFSGYMDKIFLPFFQTYVQISQKTGSMKDSHFNRVENMTQCELKIPTFAQFIQSEVSKNVSYFFTFEGHFRPIHTHCNPCAVSFDIVGKMESFRQDTEYILSKAGLSLSDVAGDPNTFEARSDLSIMSDIAWRTLISPVWRQTEEDPSCRPVRHELLRRLWTTFQVRGLLSASVWYPLGAEQSAEATLPDLLLAIKDGYDASGDRRQRLQQREAAMIEAFRSVPVDHLKRLQAIHRVDCVLFDYDCSLDRFLHASDRLPDHAFFKNWQ